MESAKIPCTAIILTLNSEKVLRRCLESIKDVDEIILVDGNSTDSTHVIAREFGARIIKQKETDEPNIRIDNFTEVRQKGIDTAKNDWIINIDSDEWFSSELMGQICDIIATNDPFVVLQAPDLIVLNDGNGAVIKHAWSYPHYSMLRLFNKKGDTSLRGGKKVHERWMLGEKAKEVFAKNAVYFSYRPYAEFKIKTTYYLGLSEQEFCSYEITFFQLIKNIWYRNVRSIVVIFYRVIKTYVLYGFKDVLPLQFIFQSLRFQIMLIILGTHVFIQQKFK